jgi:hypothetical protein
MRRNYRKIHCKCLQNIDKLGSSLLAAQRMVAGATEGRLVVPAVILREWTVNALQGGGPAWKMPAMAVNVRDATPRMFHDRGPKVPAFRHRRPPVIGKHAIPGWRGPRRTLFARRG